MKNSVHGDDERFRDEIAFWRLLVEQSRDGIVILTTRGKVYETNKRFADMLGYSVAEVRKLHMWEWDSLHGKEDLLGMAAAVDAAGDHFQTRHTRKDGSWYDVEISTSGTVYRGHKLILCICRDITERKKFEKERELLIKKLQKAVDEIKNLEGIIPICARCKKVRNDKGYWEQVEAYVSKHSSARFSHGICPECVKICYPGLAGPDGAAADKN